MLRRSRPALPTIADRKLLRSHRTLKALWHDEGVILDLAHTGTPSVRMLGITLPQSLTARVDDFID